MELALLQSAKCLVKWRARPAARLILVPPLSGHTEVASTPAAVGLHIAFRTCRFEFLRVHLADEGVVGADAIFACHALTAEQLLARYVPTFAYEFNDENAPQLFLPPVSFPYGAAHASEIQYLFDVPDQVGAPPLTADQQQLADTMVRYWTKFARSGKPKASHRPRWPIYRGTDLLNQELLSLVAPLPEKEFGLTFNSDHQCPFWDALLGN